MVHEIYIIDNNNELIENLKESFKRELDEFNFKTVQTSEIEVALKNIPSLIIIDEDTTDVNIVEFCKSIRSNEDNSITPIIVVSSNRDREHVVNVLKTDVEYYIKKPLHEEYFYYTIKNIVGLLAKNRRVSPLTGLPGNVQIQTEMKKRLLNKDTFAMLYFDLDNFKAYNDVYGFANGDEIIKFTARTMSKHIHQLDSSESFIGHIGGDDFVAIIEPTDYDKLCQNIIAEFDKLVVDFYNEVDVERGYVEVANRRGIIEQFPLTSISIAVLEVDSKIYKTTLEIGEVAGQVKHKAKAVLGSTYVINKRRF
ncbi:MAG: diguanylate cyclase [Clostridia bacterium]|nr:diguanylate cyclase [Clostridia bacterium]